MFNVCSSNTSFCIWALFIFAFFPSIAFNQRLCRNHYKSICCYCCNMLWRLCLRWSCHRSLQWLPEWLDFKWFTVYTSVSCLCNGYQLEAVYTRMLPGLAFAMAFKVPQREAVIHKCFLHWALQWLSNCFNCKRFKPERFLHWVL